jgi:hypothetical protein
MRRIPVANTVSRYPRRAHARRSCFDSRDSPDTIRCALPARPNATHGGLTPAALVSSVRFSPDNARLPRRTVVSLPTKTPAVAGANCTHGGLTPAAPCECAFVHPENRHSPRRTVVVTAPGAGGVSPPWQTQRAGIAKRISAIASARATRSGGVSPRGKLSAPV